MMNRGVPFGQGRRELCVLSRRDRDVCAFKKLCDIVHNTAGTGDVLRSSRLDPGVSFNYSWYVGLKLF